MAEPTRLKNIEYKRIDGKSLLLNLDLPAKAEKPYPVVIYIHGGGWHGGTKDGRPVLRAVDDHLLEQGYAIASINYRLSLEAIFPAQIEDCKAAVRWLRANAATYDLDNESIGIWGFSAGGHLGALVGTTTDVKHFEQEEPHLEYSSRVQAVAIFAAPIDFTLEKHPEIINWEQNEIGFDPHTKLLGGSVREHPELAVKATPLTYLSSDCPPFLIINGDKDILVPPIHAEMLYNALVEKGVEANLYIIPDGDHGMGGLPEDESHKIINMVQAFFDKHLRDN